MRGWGEPLGDGAVAASDVVSLVIVIVLLLPGLLFALILAIEGLLALALLPLLAAIRLLLPVPWQVVTRGRDAAGRRTQYAAQVRGWRASRQVIVGVSGEIRVHGLPRSLGAALAQDPDGDIARRPIPVPTGVPVAVERGDDSDRRALGDCVVARFTGTDGRWYSFAVTPRHRVGLEALIG